MREPSCERREGPDCAAYPVTSDREESAMDSEMTLDELLADPIVRMVMDRDGVEADDVRALFETLRRRIAANPDHPLRSGSRYRLMNCPRMDHAVTDWRPPLHAQAAARYPLP
jgi:hypothetical protein